MEVNMLMSVMKNYFQRDGFYKKIVAFVFKYFNACI